MDREGDRIESALDFARGQIFARCFHGIYDRRLNPIGSVCVTANDRAGSRITRRNRTAFASHRQPDLFSFVGAGDVIASNDSHNVSARMPVERLDDPVSARGAKADPIPSTAPAVRDRSGAPTRVVSLDELPKYPQLDQDLVDQTIAALPPSKMWFTYQAIRDCFGVSRATVARRVKKGLVPGIRFRGNSVIEDGSVRRFDRTQLRWLLLSVRSQPQ